MTFQKKFRSRTNTGLFNIQEALGSFFDQHKGRQNLHIVHLWENWEMVLGEDLAQVALPLGMNDRTLILGAEDNMIMQELSFQLPEIIQRVNIFMDEDFFTKARLELLQNRTPLYPPPPKTTHPTEKEKRVRPDNLGALLNKVDPETAIGRAYISYVKSFDE